MAANEKQADSSDEEIPAANEQLRRRVDELERAAQELEQRVAERTTELAAVLRECEQKGAALRESEERIRTILETASDAIITINAVGTIETFNPAAERMFDYPASEVLGQNVTMLMPTTYAEQYGQNLRDYLASAEPRAVGVRREVVGRRKDGSTFPVELSFSEIDHLRHFTGVARDISERVALQKQVLEATAAEQRRIGQDLHDVVQQELTGLGLLAQSLAETLEKLATKKDVAEGESVRQLAELASKIAEGISYTNGTIRLLSRGLIPVEVDSHGLMWALSELAARTMQLHRVDCRFVCEQPVEVRDESLATHLYRIAQEAVTNSLKHAEADEIEIHLHRSEEGLTMTVADNGIGIAPNGGTGSGMGLQIMEYRANLIGAAFDVRPIADSGTLVMCRLPES